jgi:four helix bundle protein
MKLEVWHDAMDLLTLVWAVVGQAASIDLRLKSQILDASQSVSSNIAEGYCRKTLNEYLYFINVSLGSMGELMTRMSGLLLMKRISEESYEAFDLCHYRVENKLLGLKKSLQSKRLQGHWEELIPQAMHRSEFTAH